MTLRRYLFLMAIAACLCWVAWFFVLSSVDPATSGLVGFLFFYFSLWLAVVGSFSVLGFLGRRLLVHDDEIVFRHVKQTFRQSVIIASLTSLALIFLAHGLLTWWNVILLIFAGVFVEGIIFTNRRYRNGSYV
ncbi:MAG: hypothetical protein EXS55_02130 [Candidatus Magasanikbacteria bacterium]|nr:hypothetical protein [Candidatus Magasanikbacteria bacterium]